MQAIPLVIGDLPRQVCNRRLSETAYQSQLPPEYGFWMLQPGYTTGLSSGLSRINTALDISFPSRLGGSDLGRMLNLFVIFTQVSTDVYYSHQHNNIRLLPLSTSQLAERLLLDVFAI